MMSALKTFQDSDFWIRDDQIKDDHQIPNKCSCFPFVPQICIHIVVCLNKIQRSIIAIGWLPFLFIFFLRNWVMGPIGFPIV